MTSTHPPLEHSRLEVECITASSSVASLASGQSRPTAGSFLLTLGSVSVDWFDQNQNGTRHMTRQFHRHQTKCQQKKSWPQASSDRTQEEGPKTRLGSDKSTDTQPSVNKKRAGRRPALTRHKRSSLTSVE